MAQGKITIEKMKNNTNQPNAGNRMFRNEPMAVERELTTN